MDNLNEQAFAHSLEIYSLCKDHNHHPKVFTIGAAHFVGQSCASLDMDIDQFKQVLQLVEETYLDGCKLLTKIRNKQDE